MKRIGFCFFFQAEDGIRDAQESRGLGDVYKRQELFNIFGKENGKTFARSKY
ncbi:hypothetical protein CDFC105_30022 [Clostridioides difficile]|nr:hypothetical protein CDFC105_30022 [Clostridioides difficile]